ncbi:hypothetical protein [Fictibacillus phosphorivorans]|uniref:hypothetical protein n=1 Tax=Fictibacillus phosphorivorans TaxID=1221500 RepID=UPI001292E7F9|nr:hypothetical protein [Fictibacillus phosphorivorans]MQR94789.1 hypothetical protein [Fictibacillus phosphorivorans]
MKKILGTLIIGSLLYVLPDNVSATSLSETERQVHLAAIASTILHEKYTQNLDYKTLIGTPYINARYEVGKAKKMVDSLSNSERKKQLLTRVAGYQKIVKNGNAYNNAVRTYPILVNYKEKYLDVFLNDSRPYIIKDYNYFNYKLSLLQPNYDKVYGKFIQNEFKTRYLNSIKKTRDEVYYLMNAKKNLDLAMKSQYGNSEESYRQLTNALACLKNVSTSKQKELFLEQYTLIKNILEDNQAGRDYFYISKGSYSLGPTMKMYSNLEGESVHLWIADAEKYPSYESLKKVDGKKVYGYFSSDHAGYTISNFNWTYRDWSSAYHTNIVWGYWDIDWINNENDALIPVGKKIKVLFEVVKENGDVTLNEEVFTMTEDLFRKAHVR